MKTTSFTSEMSPSNGPVKTNNQTSMKPDVHQKVKILYILYYIHTALLSF